MDRRVVNRKRNDKIEKGGSRERGRDNIKKELYRKIDGLLSYVNCKGGRSRFTTKDSRSENLKAVPLQIQIQN